MVLLKIADKKLALCFAYAVLTAPVFSTACTEQHIARKVDENEKKLLLYCKHYYVVVDRRQRIELKFSRTFYLEYFASKKLPYTNASSASRRNVKILRR